MSEWKKKFQCKDLRARTPRVECYSITGCQAYLFETHRPRRGRPAGPGLSWDRYYGFMGKKRFREGSEWMPRDSGVVDARNDFSRQF